METEILFLKWDLGKKNSDTGNSPVNSVLLPKLKS